MNILWIAYAAIVRNSLAAAPAQLCPLSRTRRAQLVHAGLSTQAAACKGKTVLSPHSARSINYY
jgi:hypothetical protein